MRLKILILYLIGFLAIMRPVQAQEQGHKSYQKAYQLLKGMLEDSLALSFKKAVFVTENAYLNEQLEYEGYETAISQMAAWCKTIAENRSLLYGQEDKDEIEKLAAVFTFMADTIPILQEGDTLYHLPFGYDFEDIWGEQDWSKMLISKLMATGTGNCHSLPYLYKILADELGAKS
jgi:hypothetical protein